MKNFSYFSVIGLLASTLFFATSCEKATVAPEMAVNASSEDANSKTLGIETRVSGIAADGSAFNATLRINSFQFLNGLLSVTAQLQQVGGNGSKATKAGLEAGTYTFYVRTPDYQYYAPGSVPTNSFTFQVADYPLGSSDFRLNAEPTVIIDPAIRKYDQIADTLAMIAALYTNTDGTYHSLDLNGISTLALYLDAIAAISGRS